MDRLRLRCSLFGKWMQRQKAASIGSDISKHQRDSTDRGEVEKSELA